MRPAQQQKTEDAADEAHEHIPLRVPDITLRSKERIRCSPGRDRNSPLEELIERAEAQHDHHGDERDPRRRNNLLSHENFSCDKRRNKPLQEMAETIIVVALETKSVP